MRIDRQALCRFGRLWEGEGGVLPPPRAAHAARFGTLSTVDNDWAIKKLELFLDVTSVSVTSGAWGVSRQLTHKADTINAAAQIAEKIMDRVTPGWRRSFLNLPDPLWEAHRACAVRALVEIRNADEISRGLGEDVPALKVSAMHSWVWESASSLWQSGHYAEAVRAATVKLNAELQNKVGRRDVSETTLVQQCFSDDPPKDGSPRLRLAGDDGGKTAKSVRRGVVALGEAVFGSIRNPASHDPLVEISEQIALEQLAAVSLLARWLDGASEVPR